ncbi:MULTISPECIES: HIT family protein [unclassified Streptomyces]|uniref:HIT family protein n=1 Tax=unclassified Streptomyces TaxID=2593676 RepID=UPI003868FE6E
MTLSTTPCSESPGCTTSTSPDRRAVGLVTDHIRTSQRSFTGQVLARALRRSGLLCEGVNLFLADGEAAFQEVFHVHLHALPRFAGDPFRIDADWRVHERDQLDVTAAAVRDGLAALDSGSC